MKLLNRVYAIILLALAGSIPAHAQFSSVAAHITYGTSIPATCKPGTGDIFFKTTATVGPYYCSATNTWTFFGTAGGSGAVNGPATSSDSAVALWDGTSGTLLKNSVLFFDGTTLSGPQTISTGDGTAAGCATWKELAANGTNNRKWCAPDALTASLTFNWADALPTAGQVMAFSAPVAGVSTQSWVTPAAGGATIPNTTNLIAGNGSGNGADSKLGITGPPTTGAAFSFPVDASTFTFPGTGTLVTKNSIDVFTNKTYDTAGSGNSFSINGVAASANTGTGAVARQTSPAFVTPALGTPASGVATNITGLPIDGGTTGTLPVNRGGTGTTTPGLVQGTNVTITGTWPNQTINSSGGGGSSVSVNYGYDGGTLVTTSATTLCTVSVPAGTLGTGGASGHSLIMRFTYVNNTASGNISVAINYGSSSHTIIAVDGSNSTTSLSGEYMLVNDLGSTTAQSLLFVSQSRTVAGTTSAGIFDQSVYEPAQNSGSGTLDFSLKATAATTNQTIRVFQCSISLI
jgi:hypothetical protein